MVIRDARIGNRHDDAPAANGAVPGRGRADVSPGRAGRPRDPFQRLPEITQAPQVPKRGVVGDRGGLVDAVRLGVDHLRIALELLNCVRDGLARLHLEKLLARAIHRLDGADVGVTSNLAARVRRHTRGELDDDLVCNRLGRRIGGALQGPKRLLCGRRTRESQDEDCDDDGEATKHGGRHSSRFGGGKRFLIRARPATIGHRGVRRRHTVDPAVPTVTTPATDGRYVRRTSPSRDRRARGPSGDQRPRDRDPDGDRLERRRLEHDRACILHASARLRARDLDRSPDTAPAATERARRKRQGTPRRRGHRPAPLQVPWRHAHTRHTTCSRADQNSPWN